MSRGTKWTSIGATVAVALAIGAGCRREQTHRPAPATQPAGPKAATPAEIERAQAALAPLEKGLKQALLAAMSEGGPVAAIDVCRDRAPAIAAEARRPGVELGRTSHKLRNPSNAPREWVRPLLEAYRTEPRADAPPHRTTRLPDGRLGYVEPIYVDALCLTCHGAQLAPPIAEQIDALYPTDQARGFEPDDFRGLFWVELTPDP